MFRKITVSKAQIGDQFSISRGRNREYLGTLLTKTPSFDRHGKRNGWMVTFGEGGEILYSSFAGGATVLLKHVSDSYCQDKTCPQYGAALVDGLCPAAAPTPKPDIQIVNPASHPAAPSTVYLVEALSEAGQEWIKERLSTESSWWGNAIVVEHRFIEDIVQGAIADGLVVM